MDSPFDIFDLLFQHFNLITLITTVVLLLILFLLRKRLEKIPLIGILAILGCLANYSHTFKSYSDICSIPGVDCTFYIVDPHNIKQPLLSEILEIIPSAIIMTIVITFEQFLYLEEFQRRGKRYKNEGTLG